MDAKDSADRVKSLLGEKTSFSEQEEKGAQMRTHSCKAIKTPRIPELLYLLFPSLLKKISERKTNAVTPEWNEESKHTHDFGSQVESSKIPGADLIPARVKRWKISEFEGIARKIRTMSKQRAVTRRFEIQSLDEKPQTSARQDSAQDQLWQEMMKAKEERQFQIGRITKYFS